jgi:3-methyladenine DNA glycosylase/8-oxoguanine DNA glycosylase
MRVGRMDGLFGRVILAICLQMAPLARSRRMLDAILRHYGDRIEFDGVRMTVWPSPGKLARAGERGLRDKAGLGYRAGRLIAAARFLSENPMSIRQLDVMPDRQAIEWVEKVPGIGGYSAGIILGRHAPIDAWSVIVMSELLLGRTPEHPRAEIERISRLVQERWGNWSWMAFAYILNDLENLASEYRLTRLV